MSHHTWLFFLVNIFSYANIFTNEFLCQIYETSEYVFLNCDLFDQQCFGIEFISLVIHANDDVCSMYTEHTACLPQLTEMYVDPVFYFLFFEYCIHQLFLKGYLIATRLKLFEQKSFWRNIAFPTVSSDSFLVISESSWLQNQAVCAQASIFWMSHPTSCHCDGTDGHHI